MLVSLQKVMAERGRETSTKSDSETSVCAVFNLIDSGEISFAAFERNEKLKSEVKMILQVRKSPELSSKIKEFDTAETSELERLVTGELDDSSWDLLWVNYHKLRLGKLKEMWGGLRKDLQLNELDPILEQTVLDYVLD